MLKKYLLIISAVAVLTSSCSHSRNKPGRQYFDDMINSLAYESYSPNPVFKDGKTNQLPVKGTIARGHLPYHFAAKSADEQLRAGKELVNPVPVDEASLTKGKALFEVYCAICHGPGGKGDGSLHASGKFTALPADLTSERIVKFEDGQIFHVITVGSVSGLMGPHATQILPNDRWMIVNYIKNNFSDKPNNQNLNSSNDGK
ncbi:MAG: c-type cytochrome [Bacteroidales bacterium]